MLNYDIQECANVTFSQTDMSTSIRVLTDKSTSQFVKTYK